MDTQVSLVDVRLVLAIEEAGSIGAAASLTHVSQPSASQRLAVLERRLGTVLVERDTTGARLTPAGELFAEHGRRAIELVDRAVTAARSPEGLRLRVGTIGSLAPAVFPALRRTVPDHVVESTTDHGRYLARKVSDGSLDAAVMGVSPAESPAPSVRRVRLGRDSIVLVGGRRTTGSGRRPLAGQTVAVASYGDEYDVIADRVARRGGDPVPAASTATAVALARQEGWLAAVPRTTVAALAVELPVLRGVDLGLDVPLWLVARGARAEVLVNRARRLGRQLGLRSLAA